MWNKIDRNCGFGTGILSWFQIHRCSHTHAHKSFTSKHTSRHALPSSQLLKLSWSIQDMPLENVAATENVSLDIWWVVYVLSRIENLFNWSSYNVSRPLNLCEKASWVSRLHKALSVFWLSKMIESTFLHHFGFWTVHAHRKQEFFNRTFLHSLISVNLVLPFFL